LEISVAKLEGRPSNRWEDNIKIHVKGKSHNNVDWIHLAQKMVLDHQVPYEAEHFLSR
jgi:hypothetical protein